MGPKVASCVCDFIFELAYTIVFPYAGLQKHAFHFLFVLQYSRGTLLVPVE